jgi:MFS family permease
VDDVPLRAWSAALVIGQAIAALLIASAPTWWALGAGFFLLRLSGQGLMGHAASTTMARYYDARRGTALAVSGLGYAGGEAILPPLGVWCAVAFGWRLTWTGVAAVDLLVALPIIFVLLRGHAARHVAFMAARTAQREATTTGPQTVTDWTVGQVVRDRRFLLMLPALLAPGFIVTGIFFHATALIEPRGWTPVWWGACFTGFAAAQLPSTFIAGALVDRLAAQRLAPGLLIPLSTGLAVLGLVSDRLGALGFLVLAGISSGCIGPIVGALWAELYGVAHLGAIRGLASALTVLATGVSPVLFGAAIDADLGIGPLALLCGAATVIATIALTIGLRASHNGQPER